MATYFRDGFKAYRVKFKLSDGGNRLPVHGYLGFPLLMKTRAHVSTQCTSAAKIKCER